jgi:hypothetical protein
MNIPAATPTFSESECGMMGMVRRRLQRETHCPESPEASFPKTIANRSGAENAFSGTVSPLSEAP